MAMVWLPAMYVVIGVAVGYGAWQVTGAIIGFVMGAAASGLGIWMYRGGQSR